MQECTAAWLKNTLQPFPAVPLVDQLPAALQTPFICPIPMSYRYSIDPISFPMIQITEKEYLCIDLIHLFMICCNARHVDFTGTEENKIWIWDTLLALPFRIFKSYIPCLEGLILDRNAKTTTSSTKFRPDRLMYLHSTLVFKGTL